MSIWSPHKGKLKVFTVDNGGSSPSIPTKIKLKLGDIDKLEKSQIVQICKSNTTKYL